MNALLHETSLEDVASPIDTSNPATDAEWHAAPDRPEKTGAGLIDFVSNGGRLQRVFDAYQSALDLHAIVAVTDGRGKILFVNSKFCAISGYGSAELVGRSHKVVNSGYHPPGFFQKMWRTIAGGEVWHGEICNRSKAGALYWVDTTVVPVFDGAGRVEAFVSIRYDITQRKNYEQALQQEVDARRKAEDLLRDVIDTIPDGVAAFDPEDRLIVHNHAYAEFFGRSRDAIRTGATFEAILRHGLENRQFVLSRNSDEARETWLRARMRDHGRPGRKTVQAMADGRWFQIQERRSAAGNVVGTRTDITELKRSEAAIKHHAEHDPLTGLYNRSVLDIRLRQAMDNAARTRSDGAIVVIDLDGFKQVNDTLGHAAGDLLLVNVARRLETVLRKSDTVIRLGGDEFAVILPQVARAGIDRICERLIGAVIPPLIYDQETIKPRLSLGVALFPQDGATAESLLQKADIALYQAKSASQPKYCVYSDALHARQDERRRMSGALSAAVEADRIEIALQPQFRLQDSGHTGFEALARWTHDGNAVSPADFIPVAEASGLASGLGNRVFERTFAAIRRIKGLGLEAGRTAVNISEAQLIAPDFPVMLGNMVQQHGLTPADIELELTENILLDRNQAKVDENLSRLRVMGFTIALDDFGTGFSSLSHLRRYAIDTIKIDRSFIARILSEPQSFAIVKAAIGLAHDLGLRVVAEGIETEEQARLLRTHGCDFGQGYLVARPLHPDAVPDFLREAGGSGAPLTAARIVLPV
jgi:diguanylate cyclase (GGDEF)-like protein/PAS domain S-box-containing protein